MSLSTTESSSSTVVPAASSSLSKIRKLEKDLKSREKELQIAYTMFPESTRIILRTEIAKLQRKIDKLQGKPDSRRLEDYSYSDSDSDSDSDYDYDSDSDSRIQTASRKKQSGSKYAPPSGRLGADSDYKKPDPRSDYKKPYLRKVVRGGTRKSKRRRNRKTRRRRKN